MKPNTANLGWALALLFAAAAALFAWQYAQARRDAVAIRYEYDTLRLRIDKQVQRNDELDASLRALSQQLSDAQTRIELLGKSLPPAQPQQP